MSRPEGAFSALHTGFGPVIRSAAYRGVRDYVTDAEEGAHRLLIAVPCQVGAFPYASPALLDTGAEWSVLSTEVFELLGGPECDIGEEAVLSSRFGRIKGNLARVPIRFAAGEGEDLEFIATFFASPDWYGPTVLGWRGCLERMRFALDPARDLFYFSALDDEEG